MEHCEELLRLAADSCGAPHVVFPQQCMVTSEPTVAEKMVEAARG